MPITVDPSILREMKDLESKARKVDVPLGVKSDSGKLEYHLLPRDAVGEVVRVLMYGAYEAPRPDGGSGYGEGNWQHVKNARKRYYNATMRHLTDWMDGEKSDKQSGKSHLAHAACCVLFLLALEMRGTLAE